MKCLKKCNFETEKKNQKLPKIGLILLFLLNLKQIFKKSMLGQNVLGQSKNF